MDIIDKEEIRKLEEENRKLKSLIQRLPYLLYACSPIRHALFTPNELPRLVENVITRELETENIESSVKVSGLEFLAAMQKSIDNAQERAERTKQHLEKLRNSNLST